MSRAQLARPSRPRKEWEANEWVGVRGGAVAVGQWVYTFSLAYAHYSPPHQLPTYTNLY